MTTRRTRLKSTTNHHNDTNRKATPVALLNAADVRPGNILSIKVRKDQTIAQAPKWLVNDYEVIEVGDTVTSVRWFLTPHGEHTHKGARPGEVHEYTAHPYGRYTVAR